MRRTIGLRVLAAIVLAGTSLAVAWQTLAGFSEGGSMPAFVFVAGAYLLVGMLVIERQPRNAAGPILFAMGVLVAVYVVADILIRQPRPPSIAPYMALSVTLLDAPLFAMVAFLFLLLPNGRIPGPGWRWVPAATVAFGTVSLVGTAVLPGPFPFYPWIGNPLGVPNLAWRDTVSLFYVATIAMVGISALSLVGRWRRGGTIERAQLKWVAAAAALIALVMAIYAIVFGPGKFNDVADLAVGAALGFFPIAIGIAILRYRLFEIDRIVSRTIAYGLLTALLVGTYATAIIFLQNTLSPVIGSETILVALSTLIVAAVFQPLRRRLQRTVDRRFDRARIDADRTATAFSERLRDEVDIEAVTSDLRETVSASIRPARLGLWLREGGR